MDAGKFNFNNLGGLRPKQPATPLQGQPKDSPSVQQDPSESVVLGNRPLADAKIDTVTSGSNDIKAEAPTSQFTSSPSAIPDRVGSFLIAGPSSVSGASRTNRASFDGIATHGTRSTSFQTLGDTTVASANPLKPVDGMRMPTTSLDLVVDTFGGGPWFSTSGRQIG